MEIVKKNVLSITFGAIALLALIALYYPVDGMYEEQRTVLATRTKAYQDIKQLQASQRSWPIMPDSVDTQKASLGRFPNETVINVGIEIKNAVHQQAEQLQRDSGGTNVHEVLVSQSLPKALGNTRFVFVTAYHDMVGALDKTFPTGVKPGTLLQPLQGGMPPDDNLVLAKAAEIYKTVYEPKILVFNDKPVNYESVVKDWQDECKNLQLHIRNHYAGVETFPLLQKDAPVPYKMYIEPTAVNIAPNIKSDPPASETEIWLAQTSLWVQQDLVDGLAKANASSMRVTDSPVKRLFVLNVPTEFSQLYALGDADGSGAAARNIPIGKAYSRTPTGRICNTMYDVAQFTLVIDVDAGQVQKVLAELQRDKLITVTQVDMTEVDGIADAADGFIYGNVPVVKLVIHGEELFLREWTTKLMPDGIKSQLQIPLTAPSNPNTPR